MTGCLTRGCTRLLAFVRCRPPMTERAQPGGQAIRRPPRRWKWMWNTL